MRKILKYTVIVLAILFLAAQFVRPDLTNPSVDPEQGLQASVAVPENVAAILKRSCSDCHTNETTHPWYAQVTPVNWWLKNHIDEGRREMNFSVWSTYSDRRKSKKLEEICEQVESGEMPLPSYLWAHRDAALTKEDAQLLCEWSRNLRTTLPETGK